VIRPDQPGLFTWAMSSGRSLEQAMTMTFVSLVLIQFFKGKVD
jgi:Ca2+-transporting ATPase